MTRQKAKLRRLGLQQIVRAPAPLDYDLAPHNREQRRRLARELRRQATRRRLKPEPGEAA